VRGWAFGTRSKGKQIILPLTEKQVL
jgi:hypothetical protein